MDAKSNAFLAGVSDATLRKLLSVNGKEVEAIKAGPFFIHKANCAEGLPIHTFHIPGEQLEGRLRPCKAFDRADRARTAELWYINAQDVEQGVAIRLTKRLWGTINKNHLWGQYIIVTYEGSLKPRGKLHPEKLYHVQVDKGCITPNIEGVPNYVSRSSKPRTRREIRRPEPVGAAG